MLDDMLELFSDLLGQTFGKEKTKSGPVLKHLGVFISVEEEEQIKVWLGPGRVTKLRNQIQEILNSNRLSSSD
jgi:phosphotransferase system IIB component